MRLRTLKPGFFTNDELAEIPPLGRLLFAGLWCMADRAGRLEDRPKKIKAQILPYDDCKIEALLDALAKRGFIVRYAHEGAPYLQITNFLKHQNPHVKEAESTIPAPDEHSASTVLAGKPSDASNRTSTPSIGDLSLGSGEGDAPERAADEPPVLVASISELTEDRPHGMVAMLCEENGKEIAAMPPDWVSRQRGIAKRLIEQGYGIERVRAYVRFRKSDWNGATPFDFRHVEKDIPAWELAGSPPTATARAPNGRPPLRASRIDVPTETTITGKVDHDDLNRRLQEVEDRRSASGHHAAG
jgi:hypothetical protein